MPLLFRFSAAMRLSGQRAFSRVFAARKTAGNGSVVVHAAARPAEEPPRPPDTAAGWLSELSNPQRQSALYF